MFMTGGDIKLDPRLMDVLSQQGTRQQGKLNDVYSQIRSGYGADRKARGLAANPTDGYFDQRLGQVQNLGNMGLQSALGGVLGDTGYKNALSERDFQQNYELAKLTGELNQPSTLEQVLGGLGGGAKAGGQFYGLYDRYANKPPKPKNFQVASDFDFSGLA